MDLQNGDSGASVITNERNIVGIVYAHTCMDDVHIIIDKANKIPEIATIAERRRNNGSVDTKGLTPSIFCGESFVLVQISRAGPGALFSYNRGQFGCIRLKL